jgi:hypothetical protein
MRQRVRFLFIERRELLYLQFQKLQQLQMIKRGFARRMKVNKGKNALWNPLKEVLHDQSGFG